MATPRRSRPVPRRSVVSAPKDGDAASENADGHRRGGWQLRACLIVGGVLLAGCAYIFIWARPTTLTGWAVLVIAAGVSVMLITAGMPVNLLHRWGRAIGAGATAMAVVAALAAIPAVNDQLTSGASTSSESPSPGQSQVTATASTSPGYFTLSADHARVDEEITITGNGLPPYAIVWAQGIANGDGWIFDGPEAQVGADGSVVYAVTPLSKDNVDSGSAPRFGQGQLRVVVKTRDREDHDWYFDFGYVA